MPQSIKLSTMKTDRKASANHKAVGKSAPISAVKPAGKSAARKTASKRQAEPPVPPDAPETDVDLLRDEIARRAYFTYLNAGRPDGRDLQHWFDAEAQLARR